LGKKEVVLSGTRKRGKTAGAALNLNGESLPQLHISTNLKPGRGVRWGGCKPPRVERGTRKLVVKSRGERLGNMWRLERRGKEEKIILYKQTPLGGEGCEQDIDWMPKSDGNVSGKAIYHRPPAVEVHVGESWTLIPVPLGRIGNKKTYWIRNI